MRYIVEAVGGWEGQSFNSHHRSTGPNIAFISASDITPRQELIAPQRCYRHVPLRRSIRRCNVYMLLCTEDSCCR